MEYRNLGNTDIKISALALGCWSFGGGGPWGEQDDRDSIDTVSAALDAGINFFDTAEGYGRSEEVLGQALAGRRDRAVLATKINYNHLTGPELIAACEDSLRRLRTDWIDLYQIHWPNPAVPVEESLAAMQTLQAKGKIRAIGVSNFGVRDTTRALAACHVDTNQISYGLLWRAPEFEIAPLCRQHDVGIICWGPLGEGLLSGKFASADDVPRSRRGTRYFSGARPETSHGEEGCEELTFATIEAVRRISQEIRQPMAAVALAWLLYQPGVTAVLAGARTPQQIRENARAGRLALTPETVAALSAATEELKQRLGSNQDMYLSADQSRIV